MKRIVVRRVEGVFEELQARNPAGIRYTCLRLADGVRFVHHASIETADGSNPLGQLDAFKAFRKDIKERCVEAPQASDATIVGSYRLFGEYQDLG